MTLPKILNNYHAAVFMIAIVALRKNRTPSTVYEPVRLLLENERHPRSFWHTHNSVNKISNNKLVYYASEPHNKSCLQQGSQKSSMLILSVVGPSELLPVLPVCHPLLRLLVIIQRVLRTTGMALKVSTKRHVVG